MSQTQILPALLSAPPSRTFLRPRAWDVARQLLTSLFGQVPRLWRQANGNGRLTPDQLREIGVLPDQWLDETISPRDRVLWRLYTGDRLD